jgi:small subunit ribosomal protein S10
MHLFRLKWKNGIKIIYFADKNSILRKYAISPLFNLVTNKKMINYRIYIKGKSFNPAFLDKSKNKVFQLCSVLGIKQVNYLRWPVHRKKITILRSPHIDKKSREQFEWRRHKMVVKTISNNSTITYLLFFY